MLANAAIWNQPAAIFVPVYISLAAYLAGLGLLAWQRHHPRLWAVARWCWTIAASALVIHVLAAFHFAHRWSHAAAYDHTAQQTAAVVGWNWGGGLWLNYLLTAAWVVDAAAWWSLGDERYSQRPQWLAISWHAFLAFMWFNAAVVFATSPARYAALAGFAVVATLYYKRGNSLCATKIF